MLTFQISLYAMAFALCTFIALLAWRAPIESRWFQVFLGALGLMFICDWLMYHPETRLKGLWLLGLMTLTFLVGPCALLLAKTIGRSEGYFNWRGHVFLIVAGGVLLFPLASSIHWGKGFFNTQNPASAQYALLIHATLLLSAVVFVVQTCLVVGACCALLRQRCTQNLSLFSETSDAGLNSLRIP